MFMASQSTQSLDILAVVSIALAVLGGLVFGIIVMISLIVVRHSDRHVSALITLTDLWKVTSPRRHKTPGGDEPVLKPRN